VHLTASDQTITARLVVSHDTALQLLQGQMESLKQRLQEAGITLGGFHVSCEDGSRQGDPRSPPPGTRRGTVGGAVSMTIAASGPAVAAAGQLDIWV